MKQLLLFLIVTLFVFQMDLNAQPERLDSSFHLNGIVTTNFSGSDDYAVASAISPDGKIVVAGNCGNHYTYFGFQAAIARYNADGTPDNTFGNEGKVLFTNTDDGEIAAMKVQPDGKIVVAGTIGSFGDFIVLRFNVSGMLDSTFGTNGTETIGFGNYYVSNYATAVALQADGKIIMSGNVGDYDDYESAAVLVRLNENGSVDSSFGSDGTVFFGADYNDFNNFSAVSIQPDGKILVGGNSFSDDPSSDEFILARFNENGAIDSTFGNHGYIGNDIHHRLNVGSILIESDSTTKIITVSSGGNAFIASRFLENGLPDSTFGNEGIDTVVMSNEVNEESYATSAILLLNGKILIAGYNFSYETGQIYAVMTRINANGFPDATFGMNGRISLSAIENITSVFQMGERIISVGYDLFGLEGYDFELKGFKMNGTIDTTFGEVNTNFANGNDFADAIGIEPDGKLVVAGYSAYNVSDIARYNDDGSPDSTFNSTGTLSFNGSTVSSVAIQNDGKILTAGLGSNSDMVVNRFNVNGTPDSSFGKNGIASHSAQYQILNCSAIALQKDGKIVVAGTESNTNSTTTFIIHRFNEDGSDDSIFGVHGDAIADFGECQSMIIQPDGKIVGAGVSSTGQFELKRFNTDGTLDHSFGMGGTAVIYSNVENFDPVVQHSIAVQPDGKLLIVSNSGNGPGQFGAVVRLNPDGSPDLSFNDTGIVLTNVNGNLVYGQAVFLQPNGKILVAGYSGKESYPAHTSFSLIRYNGDGSLDVGFGNNGIITTFINNYYANCNAALFLSGGKIVLAGNSFNGNDNDFAVVRYLTDLYTEVINFTNPAATVGYIYPNPVHTGKITLQYELPVEENISLSLLDFYGQVAVNYFTNKESSAGKHSEELLIPDHCPSGFYLLFLKTEHGNVGIKLDKQ